MAPDPNLSRREREALDIIYQLGSPTAAEVREAMASPPSDAAVRTTLRCLEQKGHVRHEYDGPRYVYHPTVPREKAKQSALNHLLETFFGGSPESAMAALLEMHGTELSPSDRKRLKKMIDDAKREGR